MSCIMKQKYTSLFDEGCDLESDELYTAWLKLKQPSLSDKPEVKDIAEGTPVEKDTGITKNSTDGDDHRSNPTIPK